MLHGKSLKYIAKEENNWVTSEINYKNGVKEGPLKYYWNNKLSVEAMYKNGVVVGIAKKFSKTGQIEVLADINKGIYKVFNLREGMEGKLLEKSEIKGVTVTNGSKKYNFNRLSGSYSKVNGNKGGIYPVKDGMSTTWDEFGNVMEKFYWEKKTNNKDWSEPSIRTEGESFRYYKSGQTKERRVNKNGSIIEEFWYNKNETLMNTAQIIEEAGTSSEGKLKRKNMHVSCGENHTDSVVVIVNDTKFCRLTPIIKFLNEPTIIESITLHPTATKKKSITDLTSMYYKHADKFDGNFHKKTDEILQKEGFLERMKISTLICKQDTLGNLMLNGKKVNGNTTLFKVKISGNTYKVHADTKISAIKEFYENRGNPWIQCNGARGTSRILTNCGDGRYIEGFYVYLQG